MNTYIIEHKVRTLAELYEGIAGNGIFEFRGFQFRQWDFTIAQGAVGEAWIARKEIQAYDFLDAISSFRRDLLDIVRRVSFVSQCFTTAELESFFVFRINNNPSQSFYYNFSEDAGPVPLHFDEDEKTSLLKLEDFNRPMALEYIAQSTRSATYTTRLAMLIIALESIAGEVTSGKTDMEFIKKKILKDEDLHDEIFHFGTGVRNKIFHGKEIVATEKNYVKVVYDKIIDFFNEEYRTSIDRSVIDPQRTPFGNYRGTHGWFRPSKEFSDWDLKRLIEINESERKRDDKLTVGTFFYAIGNMPENY